MIGCAKKLITDEEYKEANSKLMEVWECTIYDPKEMQKQFDDNFEIVQQYRRQQPISPELEKAYQEQLVQVNEQYVDQGFKCVPWEG